MGRNSATAFSQRAMPAMRIAEAFRTALDLAAAYRGATAPNPPVGCVLLDEGGAVLGCAAHRKAGEGHAEALAIEASRQAGTFGRIHTVVVTLEPCNHTGRTPPCTEAILRTGARAVWIGCADPNTSVRGGGAARLAAAGLDVGFAASLPSPEGPALGEAAAQLIAPFAKRVRTGLPWITVKQALNRAGTMLPPPGAKTFTSEASLRFAHALRKRADAILTGSGTVIADQPEFTVRRLPDFPAKRRSLAILDRRERVPESYFEAARARGFDAWRAESPEEALARIGESGALEVLVEAGPTLTASLLDEGSWDEHVTIRQPPGDGEDVITVRRQTATHREQIDVLRHH